MKPEYLYYGKKMLKNFYIINDDARFST